MRMNQLFEKKRKTADKQDEYGDNDYNKVNKKEINKFSPEKRMRNAFPI